MKAFRKKWIPLVMLSPVLLGLIVFIYYPLGRTLYDSFYEWSAYSSKHIWAGVQNYIDVLTDPITLTALKNNTLYAAFSVLFQVGLSMVMAAVLEEKFMRRFQKFFRTVLFLPCLISMAVIAIMWQLIYDPNTGLLNEMIHALGFGNITPVWLGDEKLAIFCCIFVSQWQQIGYCMLLNLIGIQNVPTDIYESAIIDGAGPVRKFLSITLPMAKESLLVTALITVIGSYKLFTEIQVLTGGGPNRSTEVLATVMYRSAFTNDQMGIASVYAVLIFVITFVLSILQLKMARTGKD